ncbi:MAG: hypothetical protein FWH36_04075 [Lentimicrobiaceae bacterium]|nr:hypothetical protein [Lentimicrobiaceae bacterium]
MDRVKTNLTDKNMMKQIIFVTTLFLFVSCGQGSSVETTKQSKNIDKNSYGQTDANELVITTETKIDEDNTPIDKALTFINSYVDNCNKMKESIGIIEWVNSNNLTTHIFKTEVKTMIEEAFKIEPEIGLDFDPIFDAQDYPDEGFELESFDSKTNFIVLKGKNWTDFKLTIKVVLEGNKWLVDGCGIVNIPNDKRSKR